MRMMITLSLEKSSLPRDYRPLITRFLQLSLHHQGGEALAQQYYGNESRKPFSFSVYLPKSYFRGEIQLESSYIKVIFSTYDENTFDDFFLSAMGMQKELLTLDEYGFTVTSVVRIIEKIIQKPSVQIRMLSPLVVRNKANEKETRGYLGIRDETFEQQLQASVASMLEGTPLEEKGIQTLHIAECLDNPGSKEAHVLHRGHFYRSILGNLCLSGEPDLLNFLYQGGMGEMREEGFGLFELIG